MGGLNVYRYWCLDFIFKHCVSSFMLSYCGYKCIGNRTNSTDIMQHKRWLSFFRQENKIFIYILKKCCRCCFAQCNHVFTVSLLKKTGSTSSISIQVLHCANTNQDEIHAASLHLQNWRQISTKSVKWFGNILQTKKYAWRLNYVFTLRAWKCHIRTGTIMKDYEV
jgi:hypothetical protein